MKLLLIASMLISSAVMADVNFINSPSLDKVVKADSVEECSPSKTLKVPVITWGGDIATINANGDSNTTQPGSLNAERGLTVELNREDSFTKQVSNYMTCKSPFLRGTVGMINMAAAVTEKNPKTKMRVVYQMTWSAGGDAMVVNSKIKKPSDLKGKTIAVQAYGPHVDYLAKVLSDAGLNIKDVTIKYVSDLTGTEQTGMKALQAGKVDATMAIIPDALALTSDGTVGTGSEDSVKGATILMSTKTANRVIADVYAVREDFYQANKQTVFKFVDALYKAQEKIAVALQKEKGKDSFADKAAANKVLKASAKMLLDSEQATNDTAGLYTDAHFVGFNGNKSFFEDANYPRGFNKLNQEVQTSFMSLGLVSSKNSIAKADWSIADFKKGLLTADKVEAPSFDTTKVATLIAKKQKQGNLDSGSLFSFEVYFSPNQDDFPIEQYKADFDKVIALSSTYAGALITVEGHSDPLGYLKKQKENSNAMVLNQVKQSAKNLSITRSNAVKAQLIRYAKSKGVAIDESQLATVGHGIDQPKNGKCNGEPCAPKTEQEWLNNMRVEFRIIQVEAESSVFSPL